MPFNMLHRKYHFKTKIVSQRHSPTIPRCARRYQQGPDTYLLQLRDVDFPVRLRQYMKLAADRSPGYAAQIRENLYDYSVSLQNS